MRVMLYHLHKHAGIKATMIVTAIVTVIAAMIVTMIVALIVAMIVALIVTIGSNNQRAGAHSVTQTGANKPLGCNWLKQTC